MHDAEFIPFFYYVCPSTSTKKEPLTKSLTANAQSEYIVIVYALQFRDGWTLMQVPRLRSPTPRLHRHYNEQPPSVASTPRHITRQRRHRRRSPPSRMPTSAGNGAYFSRMRRSASWSGDSVSSATYRRPNANDWRTASDLHRPR